VPTTEVLPDEATLRRARRARVLEAMEAADIDVLVVGREGNARYVSGAPRLWTAGSRAFGPGCVLVRATEAVHLLSTWDEGIPDDIPHENLYGISFNSGTFVKVLRGIDGADTFRTVATDAMSPSSARLLPAAFPAAELVDAEPFMRRCRSVKLPQEIDAIRASLGVAERALDAATAALEPGVTERHLTGVFMEAMAEAGVTTPATQDIAWITSRRQAWGRTGRDTPAAPGDLVAFDAGIILGGYVGEVGHTRQVDPADDPAAALRQRTGELWDRLLDACRAGLPMTGLLDAYEASGVAAPPVPVARGLGLGYDVPLVTAALPATAAQAAFESGMVLALTAYTWAEGVGAIYEQAAVHVTPDGPELLSGPANPRNPTP
jgi:Xaa-Pro aminopeptidase